jgi:competence protein ComEC
MLQMRRPGWQKHKVAPEGKGLAQAIAALWGQPLVYCGNRYSPSAARLFPFCGSNRLILADDGASDLALCRRHNHRWRLLHHLPSDRRVSLLSLPALVLLRLSGGFAAGAVRTAMVAAPVIKSDADPVILEGWVTNLRWPDVLQSGGMTVKAGGEGLIIQSAPKCGKRSWRACP